MKNICLLFLVILTSGFVKPVLASQNIPIYYCFDCGPEERVSLLKKAKTDSDKITALHNLLGNNIGYVSDKVYLIQLLELNKSAKLVDDKPYKTLKLAFEKLEKNSPNEALELFIRSVNEFDGLNIEIPHLLLRIRILFNTLNKQEEKFEFYTQKLSYYLERNEGANASACYHALAGYYRLKGDFNSSINNYLKADEQISGAVRATQMIVIGSAYNEWGNLNKGEVYLKEGLNKIRQNHPMLHAAFLGLSQLEYERRNYRKSLDYLDNIPPGNLYFPFAAVIKAFNHISLSQLPEAFQALTMAKSIADSAGLTIISNFGYFELDYGFYKYFIARNELQKAKPYLDNAYLKAKLSAEVNLRSKYLKELAIFYANTGNTNMAWQYTRLYNHVKDSLEAAHNTFKIASFENEQKDREQNKKLVALRLERAVQEATISKRNIILWISLAGFFAVCCLLFFIYRQLQINKRTLSSLRQTQRQLITSEKMASLGELTAGIAHEIQNPLNFVNNFSEVSMELIEEVKSEKSKAQSERNDELENELLGDISQNLEKINYHGKRADSIVKSMLQHSRSGSGQQEETDLNALADEYLRLSYHGLRAKDKSFNAGMVTHYGQGLPKILVMPQDIGRVLLNLFTNAFYSVTEKKKQMPHDFEPTVTVSTEKTAKHVQIRVRDNGAGISQAIINKIMQPFFTTKPAGEGTGLGLSMSYDIIRAHGGELKVESQEGEFAEFIIKLPLNS